MTPFINKRKVEKGCNTKGVARKQNSNENIMNKQGVHNPNV